MPNLGKNASGGKPKKNKKHPKPNTSKKKKSKVEEPGTDDEVITLDANPVVEPEPAPEAPQIVEQAVPFSDGIVAVCLQELIAIPTHDVAEVELFRSFLQYFSSTGSFIGTISSKTSFMKKKGVILL